MKPASSIDDARSVLLTYRGYNAPLFFTLQQRVRILFPDRNLSHGFLRIASELSGGSYSFLVNIVSFKVTPWLSSWDGSIGTKSESLRRPVITLLEWLGESYDEMFPESLDHLYESGGHEVRGSAMISAPSVMQLSAPGLSRLPAPDPFEQSEQLRDLAKIFNSVRYRAKLTKVMEAVISLRFGLDGNGERTLREVGEILGKTPERIRQIEARALRFLRVAADKQPALRYSTRES